MVTHLAHVIKGLERGGDPAGPTLTARALERLKGQRDSEGLPRGMALLALMPEGRPRAKDGGRLWEVGAEGTGSPLGPGGGVWPRPGSPCGSQDCGVIRVV